MFHKSTNTLLRPLTEYVSVPMGARQAYTATVHALWFTGVVPAQVAGSPLGDRGGWFIR